MIKIDGLLPPRVEEAAEFRRMIERAYGASYEVAEADRLLDVARVRFDEVDAWTEWPDLQLWELVTAAEQRLEWLVELASGRAPAGWRLPPKTDKRLYVTDPHRRTQMSLDSDHYRPSREIPRLKALLSASEPSSAESTPDEEVRLPKLIEALEQLGRLFRSIADDIEPALSKKEPLPKDLASVRNTLRQILGRDPDYGDGILALLHRPPFAQGRRPAPPALTDLVREFAESWERATGALPPSYRHDRQSKRGDAFVSLLHAAGRAYGRPREEINKAAIEGGLRAAKEVGAGKGSDLGPFQA